MIELHKETTMPHTLTRHIAVITCLFLSACTKLPEEVPMLAILEAPITMSWAASSRLIFCEAPG
ncbi:hypothetical protein SAMN03159507_04069 [Pseudomonas sp. NFACC32-1]|nr:hypothetical protein SAMN03159507_04069 [Pseudomonas sp. NFACC32-1]